MRVFGVVEVELVDCSERRAPVSFTPGFCPVLMKGLQES